MQRKEDDENKATKAIDELNDQLTRMKDSGTWLPYTEHSNQEDSDAEEENELQIILNLQECINDPTSLCDLNEQNLSDIGEEQWELIYRIIYYSKVSRVSLRFNGLCAIEGTPFQTMLKILEIPSLEFIDLTDNDLDTIEDKEFKTLCDSIAKTHCIQIDIGEILLDNSDGTRATQLKNAILQNYHLEALDTNEQLDSLIQEHLDDNETLHTILNEADTTLQTYQKHFENSLHQVCKSILQFSQENNPQSTHNLIHKTNFILNQLNKIYYELSSKNLEQIAIDLNLAIDQFKQHKNQEKFVTDIYHHFTEAVRYIFDTVLDDFDHAENDLLDADHDTARPFLLEIRDKKDQIFSLYAHIYFDAGNLEQALYYAKNISPYNGDLRLSLFNFCNNLLIQNQNPPLDSILTSLNCFLDKDDRFILTGLEQQTVFQIDNLLKSLIDIKLTGSKDQKLIDETTRILIIKYLMLKSIDQQPQPPSGPGLFSTDSADDIMSFIESTEKTINQKWLQSQTNNLLDQNLTALCRGITHYSPDKKRKRSIGEEEKALKEEEIETKKLKKS